MELPRERPPEYEYAFHHPDSLRLPAVPQHDLASSKKAREVTLPALSTLLSSQALDEQTMSQFAKPHVSKVASPRAYGHLDGNSPSQYASSRKSSDITMTASMGSRHSTLSHEGHQRSMSGLSMDDPDVRIAAEALSGLGNPSMATLVTEVRQLTVAGLSLSPASTVRGNVSAAPNKNVTDPDTAMEPEPLLELLAQAHPWVGGAVNGSLSAYSTTKNYSPRVVQYGANLIERNITHPMVSTVSSVGRMTGVESGLRWYLDRRRPSDVEAVGPDTLAAQRRQLFAKDAMDVDSTDEREHGRLEFRRDSSESRFETLPAYRASKPPSYREEASPASSERSRERATQARSISSQLFIMTSGLGVALSETSRQSLRYCLVGLGQATEHIRTVTDALKLVLEQYDEAREHWHQTRDSSLEKGERPQTPDHDQAARRLAEIIKKHSDDIWVTLKDVVTYVSTTAGGALPENARHFVRTQLMSLPQRWRVVRDTQPGENDTSSSAHRMIAFATEGLDMMSQVSHVCKATLDSADLWLQRVGSRRANNYISEKSRTGAILEDQPMLEANES